MTIVVRSAHYVTNSLYRLSVHLSVTEVHWRIIANLDFEIPIQIYRALCTQPTSRSARWRIVVAVHAGKRGGDEGSSRAMLATARPSYLPDVVLHWCVAVTYGCCSLAVLYVSHLLVSCGFAPRCSTSSVNEPYSWVWYVGNLKCPYRRGKNNGNFFPFPVRLSPYSALFLNAHGLVRKIEYGCLYPKHILQ